MYLVSIKFQARLLQGNTRPKKPSIIEFMIPIKFSKTDLTSMPMSFSVWPFPLHLYLLHYLWNWCRLFKGQSVYFHFLQFFMILELIKHLYNFYFPLSVKFFTLFPPRYCHFIVFGHISFRRLLYLNIWMMFVWNALRDVIIFLKLTSQYEKVIKMLKIAKSYTY